MSQQYYGHQGPAVAYISKPEPTEYKSIALKMAAFLCRMQGRDDIPLDMQGEVKALIKGFKECERKIKPKDGEQRG